MQGERVRIYHISLSCWLWSHASLLRQFSFTKHPKYQIIFKTKSLYTHRFPQLIPTLHDRCLLALHPCSTYRHKSLWDQSLKEKKPPKWTPSPVVRKDEIAWRHGLLSETVRPEEEFFWLVFQWLRGFFWLLRSCWRLEFVKSWLWTFSSSWLRVSSSDF